MSVEELKEPYGYKEFKVGSLFEIVNGKQPNLKNRNEKQEEGMVRAITGVTTNNGVGFYTKSEDIYQNELTISKDGEYAGTVFLQTEPFMLAGHSMGLISKLNLRDNVKLYIATTVDKLKPHWKKAGDRGSVGIRPLEESVITLPITTEGELDYEYMEQYVHSQARKHLQNVDAYVNHEIDLMKQIIGEEYFEDDDLIGGLEPATNWKEFRLGELFEVTSTKSTDKGGLTFIEGGVNFIGRTRDKNGVQGKIKPLEFEPNEPNTITISQVGTMVACYQEFPYYTSQNIAKVNTTELGKNESLYITTLINKHLDSYGGYNTPKISDIKEFILTLPVTSTGELDTSYMEQVTVGGGYSILRTVKSYISTVLC